MATKKVQSSAGRSATSGVDEYLATLEHPYKQGVETLRRAILALDARVTEEVKWNAPSFRLEDHFATFRLHPAPAFQLVLHAGARSKVSNRQFRLEDSDGLVKWAAKDRCSITFLSDADALSKRYAVMGIIKDWIAQL